MILKFVLLSFYIRKNLCDYCNLLNMNKISNIDLIASETEFITRIIKNSNLYKSP